MYSGEQRRFMPKDLEDVANSYWIIDEEQRMLPTWLQGLPITSAPMDLYYEMVDMQQELEKEVLPPEVFHQQYTELSHRIMLIRDVHKRHRDLMFDEAYAYKPKHALSSALADIKGLIDRDQDPYQGWGSAEHISFLDEIERAYTDFYYPGKDSVTF